MKNASRKVVCIETGEVHESVTALAKELGVQRVTVYNHLNPNVPFLRTLKGKHYHYELEPAEIKKPPLSFFSERGAVICLETGEIWDSNNQLARAINKNSSCVSKNIRGGYPILGYHYARLGAPVPPQHAATKAQERTCPTLCVETGQRFRTLREAGAFVKRGPYAVSRAADTGGCCGGYHFEWTT